MFKLGFTAGVKYNNKIFFSASMSNGLYEMDLITGKTKLLCMFYHEEMKILLHRNAFIYKNYAWFIPQKGRYITKVNLDTLEMSFFTYEYDICKENDFFAFILSKRIGNKIYLLPRSIDTFVVIDMESDKIQQMPGIIKPNEEVSIDFLIVNDEINIFFYDRDYVRNVKFDTLESKDIKCGIKAVSICEDKETLWILSSDSGEIYQYDLKRNKINETIKIGNKGKFNGSFCCEDRLVFFPINADGFLYINKCNLQFYVDELINAANSGPVKVMQIDSEDNSVILGAEGYIAIWNETNFNIVEIDISVDEYIEQFSKFIKDKKKWQEFYDGLSDWKAEHGIGLEGFIKILDYM